MENLQKFEYFDQLSQCSYQITSQMRWHPLAPDKTFLQLEGFDKIPTDNREIRGKALTIIP